MDFKPIETQEAFNEKIRERLQRETEKHSAELAELNAKYEGYEAKANKYDETVSAYEQKIADLNAQHESALNELNEKISGYNSQISEKDNQIKGYEVASLKSQVAREFGLQYGSEEFIKGDTEEEIRISAEKLKALIPNPSAPLANNSDVSVDGVTAAFLKLNPKIKL